MSVYANFTLDQLNAFKDAIAKAMATGANTVRYADRTVVYNSYTDMARAASDIDEEINSRTGATPLRRIRIDSRKGFC